MVLAAMALGLASNTRLEIRTVDNVRAAARARALAEAGINLGILAMLEPDPARRWVADGRPYDVTFAGADLRVSVQDERGKIDLNAGTALLLRRLLDANGVGSEESAALTDAILDWRDEDDLRRLNGAEGRDYREAGLEYGAKDAPFDTVDELRLVLGMTPALFQRVAPALTVYSQQAGVDTATATATVLRALPGLDAAAVDEMLAARRRDTEASAETAAPSVAATAAGTVGRAYTVRAGVDVPDGGTFVREAVVRITGDLGTPYWILAWRQGRWTPPAPGDGSAAGG